MCRCERKTWLVVGVGEQHEVRPEEIRAAREACAGYPLGDVPDVVFVAIIASRSGWPMKALLAPGVATRDEAMQRLADAATKALEASASVGKELYRTVDRLTDGDPRTPRYRELMETALCARRSFDAMIPPRKSGGA